MQDKTKIGIAVATGVLAVVLGGFAFYFKFKVENNQLNSTQVSTTTPQEEIAALQKLLPPVSCSFSSDQDAYAKAIASADINTCACVKDEGLKTKCQNATFDLNAYNEAITQYNPALCSQIQGASRKQACLSVVASGVSNLKTENPQQLANIYAQTHNDQAIPALESLLQTDPSNVNNLISLTLAYAEKGLEVQGQGGSQATYVNQALATIQKAQSLAPNNSEVYRAEAYVYEIKPDIRTALSLYGKAIALDPNNILAYVGRGHAENLSGMLANALADFKKAAALDTGQKNMDIYSNLCRLEASQGSTLNDAIKNCKIVIAAQNTDPTSKSEVYQVLASIYMQLKDYASAESYLSQAEALTPDDPNLYVTLANLDIAEEKYSEAQTAAQQAITLSPTKSVAYQALAYALYRQEKYDDAISAANKGLGLIATDVSLLTPNKSSAQKDFYYILADIYNRTGDTADETKYKQLGDAIPGSV